MSSLTVPKTNQPNWSPYVKVYDPLKAGSIDGTDLIPHDNAVVRAMSAEYNPPDERTITSNPVNTLFVGRLNLRTSERQLKDEFGQYGQVKSCRLVRDIITGMSRGYGFVEFRKESDAHRAWKAAHGSMFHERQILVEWEFSRTMPGWIPRRLGGGLGGKKESGQLRFGGRDRPFKRPFIVPADQDSSSFSGDFEQHPQIQEVDSHLRDEFGKGKNLRLEKPKFRANEFENQSSYVFDDARKYKNYSDKVLNYDEKKYKNFPKEKFFNDKINYKTFSEGKSASLSHFGEDRRGHRNDTSKFYDHPSYEEGGQKYRHKKEERYQSINHDKSKYKRVTENIYYEQGTNKYDREYSDKSSYWEDSTKYRRKSNDRYPHQLDLGIRQKKFSRDFKEKHADHSRCNENESETFKRHSQKKYKEGDNYEIDNFSHKSSESSISSKFEREADKRGRDTANLAFIGASTSKSEIVTSYRLDSTQTYEMNLKRKYRSSSISSSSSCSKSSSKKKHRRKHKKGSKKTDRGENDVSSCESGPSKKHKKSKKKKKKKSRRASKDGDTD